jgi:drug/metabolite transporter (DMT)-like permease
MLWAWAVFNEALSWAMAAGLVISLVGIFLFARAPKMAPGAGQGPH